MAGSRGGVGAAVAREQALGDLLGRQGERAVVAPAVADVQEPLAHPLVAQPELLSRLSLTVNEDIKNRVTYSVLMQKLAPDSVQDFVRAELDKAALAHSTFTDDALCLIVRSSEGVLRRARNLCLSALLEAVRDRTKTVDLKQVNRVLLQPHWRKEVDLPQ